jgi:hypothetical protein
MAMTAKDFRAIAAALRVAKAMANQREWSAEEALDHMTDLLADVSADSNGRFERERFVEAARFTTRRDYPADDVEREAI